MSGLLPRAVVCCAVGYPLGLAAVASGYVLLAVVGYLLVGAVLATALGVLDLGTRGTPTELTDVVQWLGVTVLWLPTGVFYALRLALLILLPARWTARW